MSHHVQTWLEIEGYLTKTEYRTPWGICDIVGVYFDPEYRRTRIELRQEALGPIQRVALLEAIPSKRRAYISELLQETDGLIDCADLPTELEYLRRRHFIKVPAAEYFQRVVPMRAVSNQIVAVEMKLTRFEEVVSQAISNLTLAHESYVALPDQNAARLAGSSRASELAELGVGILGVERGGCEVLLKSKGKASSVSSAVQAHCLERFWRSLRDKRS